MDFAKTLFLNPPSLQGFDGGAGRAEALKSMDGVSYRHGETIVRNPEKALIHQLDDLSSVMGGYKHDRTIENFKYVEEFYKTFYFRPRPIARMVWEMLQDRQGHEAAFA